MTAHPIYHTFPPSRIATFDVYSVGLTRHHISALLEFDVTDSRKKLRELKRAGRKVSFSGWIIHAISKAVELHPEAAAYLCSRKKLVTFGDIKVSMIVEKEVDGKKVPIPMIIEKANEKSTEEITREIEEAKDKVLSAHDIVLNEKPKFYDRLYYRLPGVLRRTFWRILLRNPEFAYRKMGNVVVTSPGMAGTIKGWFVHRTVHPLSFGIGSVLKKPVVVGNEVKVREILNMTVLVDHDVIDGAPMVRFLNDLTRFIESGSGL